MLNLQDYEQTTLGNPQRSGGSPETWGSGYEQRDGALDFFVRVQKIGLGAFGAEDLRNRSVFQRRAMKIYQEAVEAGGYERLMPIEQNDLIADKVLPMLIKGLRTIRKKKRG